MLKISNEAQRLAAVFELLCFGTNLSKQVKRMKKILIVKTGSTYPAIAAAYGDFDEMILRQMETDADKALAVAAYENRVLPPLRDLMGVVITGAHAMVTKKEAWSTALAGWLKEAADYGLPLLGICYGHQLLASVFGGIVDYHPKGVEIGTTPIRLTEAGRKDPLLGILPPVFLGHVAHSQTVLKLPPGAVALAHNEFEPHHAFVLRKRIWGVQFHPEFTSDVILNYIETDKADLTAQGVDAAAVRRSVVAHDYGHQLLLHFKQLISS